jgi:hypothetical protein
VTPTKTSYPTTSTTHIVLGAAKKGFGNTPTPPTPSQPKKTKNKGQPQQQSMAAPVGTIPQDDDVIMGDDGITFINPYDKREETETDLSMGKAALDKLRRERAESRNEELQKLKEVQEIDEMLRTTPEAAVIPERVAQRMGKRMLPFVGIPLVGSMASFVGFWYMATYQDMEFQPALVATTSIVLLAVGLVVRLRLCRLSLSLSYIIITTFFTALLVCLDNLTHCLFIIRVLRIRL